MDGTRVLLGVLAVGGWLLLARASSLFDDVDMTLGAPKVTTEATQGPGESLFGGTKMSLSTKELQGGLGGTGGIGGASVLPASGVYSLPKPRKKVASATVSTSLTGPGSGSLFDALPNAGASLPGALPPTNRYFATPSAPSQAQSASRTSLFEVEGLLLPLSRSEAAPQSGSPAPQSVSAPRPQEPPPLAPEKPHSQESMEMMKEEEEEDEEETAALSALRLLERYAPELAAALNATVRKDTATTFPHAVQGDFQLALETLSASPLQDNDHQDLDDYDYSREDDLDLFSLLNGDNDQATAVKHTRLRGGHNIADSRRRRLEDLRLALEIIQSLERDRDADEEFELRLAKSIFDQHIKSLSELTRRQRDTLHSLVTMVRGSSTSLRNPNSFILPPVKDSRPPASRRNSYLPPQRDPTPPAPPSRSYGPPQRDPEPPAPRYRPPQRDPDPPAPPARYRPPQRDPTPPAPPPFSYGPPQRDPTPPAPPPSSYGPPQRDPTPPAPPSSSYGPPQRDPTPPAPPPSSYGPPQRDPTPPAPPPSSYGPPQRDPTPPAPPSRTYGRPQQDPIPLDSFDDSEELRDPSVPQSLSLTISPADIYTVLSGIHSQPRTPVTQATPARSYGAPKKADPTVKPVYYIAVPSNLRPQADPPQADPQPPAPPPPAPPAPPPPPVPTTTRRPSTGYLPPRDEVQPRRPSYRPLADPLPLEGLDSLEDDSWRPILSPAAPRRYDYDQRPSDQPRDAVRNGTSSHHVYNYHYHYHFGQGDSSASDEERPSDDSGTTKERLDDAPSDAVNMDYGGGSLYREALSSPPSTSTPRRTRPRQADAVSSYSSLSASDDSLELPSFQPPAPAAPPGGYGAPPADPPAPPPPMKGYGAPPADPPSPPPMRYGPPPADPPAPPPMRYGPPPADPPAPPPPPMRYGPPPADPPAPPPMRYGPPPADAPPPPMRYAPPADPPSRYAPPPAAPPVPPPSFYGVPQAPTRFPRSPTPVTLAPANPTPPAPPPSTYGAPPADPRPPAPPPATYGAPPADPTPPPADPSPPAPPPITTTTTPRPVFIVPPRPPPLPKSHFSVFNKKAKPPKFFQRAPVVAVGPVRLGTGVAATLRDPQQDPVTRSPLQREQEQLQLQFLRNEQRLRQEQRTLQDINELRYQILAQEQQRDELRENLYKGLKKEKDSDLKKMFYKGAMLLGAMSLVPFAAGRRRREAPTLTVCPFDALDFSMSLHHAPNLTLSHAPNCSQAGDADPLLGDVVGVLRARQGSLLQDVTLTDLTPILPPPAALRNPGCLRRSFCRLMLDLEGTPLYEDFLDKYLQLFPVEGRGGGGVAGQALHLAHQRLSSSTEHSEETCTAYSCPYPDQDL